MQYNTKTATNAYYQRLINLLHYNYKPTRTKQLLTHPIQVTFLPLPTSFIQFTP